MKSFISKGRSVPNLSKAINEPNDNKGGTMKDSLTFKEEILSISEELNLEFEIVEDIALDLIKEGALDKELERSLSGAHDRFASLVLGVSTDDYNDGEYESASSILSNSIYNQDSEEDIERRIARERHFLNESSADVEDLTALKMQAENYFRNPKRYPIKEDDSQARLIAGYVGIYSHSEPDENGVLQDRFKSTGDVIHIKAEDADNVLVIEKELEAIGYQLNNLIQVKFYGAALSQFIGSTTYGEDETALFVSLDSGYPNLLYTVPDDNSVEDDSIYSTLNRMVQEEVIYGRAASEVLGEAFTHWSLCREFFETRLPEVEEEKREENSKAKIISLMEQRQQFKDGFACEVELVRKLNESELTISDLSEMSAHEINRILWVCKSKDFSCRIENKPAFLQLQALARKLKANESSSIGKDQSSEAFQLINFINQGGDIEKAVISDNLLKDVFAILWDRSNSIRIKAEYKDVYFTLKKRFSLLGKDDRQGKPDYEELAA